MLFVLKSRQYKKTFLVYLSFFKIYFRKKIGNFMKKIVLSLIMFFGVLTINGCAPKSAHEKWAYHQSR